MGDMRGSELGELLWQRAGELGEPARRAVLMPVDSLVVFGGAVAEVRRNVDYARPSPGALSRGEQPVDQRGGAVRCGREDRRAPRPGKHRLDLGPRLESHAGIHAREVRERGRDRLAGLAVRQDACYLEDGVCGEQAQQLAGHVAAAAEDDRGNALAHAAAHFGSRPTASMTWSPSAAPSVSALNARTPSCFSMMSTPTRLSVAGPVTTHGSTRNRSRSSVTPPHAATGSLAESTTPVMAARMSAQSRMASTP